MVSNEPTGQLWYVMRSHHKEFLNSFIKLPYYLLLHFEHILCSCKPYIMNEKVKGAHFGRNSQLKTVFTYTSICIIVLGQVCRDIDADRAILGGIRSLFSVRSAGISTLTELFLEDGR